MQQHCTLAVLVVVLVSLPAVGRGQSATVSANDVTVEFQASSGTVGVSHARAGAIVEALVVKAQADGQIAATNSRDRNVRAAADAARGELTVTVEKAFALTLSVRDGQVGLRVTGELRGQATLEARAALGPKAIAGFVRDEAQADRGVLVTTLGPAEVPGAGSLFDPDRDVAVTAGPAGQVRWNRADGGWRLSSSADAQQPLLTLRIYPNYYRNTLGIKYYAPIPKISRWPTAPAVAMTWYGIEGWSNRPAQRKEWLFPQIDWVAEHLLPYAGPNLVFQLDDNYPQNDDKIMRELSDYIRAKGLVPGIWFTPFTVAPKTVSDAHPEWFLHDKDGKIIRTFGGVNWGGNLTLNATNPQAVDSWYGMWWRKASETWNFDFFKIDGQPEVIDAYRRASDGGGIDGYHKGLEIGRSIVGPNKFINACWGTPVEAIGRVNGSRTGGDTGNDPHAVNVILGWNFLNNIAWWCDPDAAANLYRATIQRVRLNAQARVLTGQQFLTDDVWTKVPVETRRVWQRSLPTLDIRPANFYPVHDLRRYDLFDLRIAKPWATWDVVGLFNYDGRPMEKNLDLGRLPLAAPQVHVFDYWQSSYLGRLPRDARLPMRLAAYEGKLFAVMPATDDRPVLLSTSRHISQGGLDLDHVNWKQDGPRWIVTGKSSSLVKDDPYEMCFAAGRSTVASATSPAGTVARTRSGEVVRLALTPRRSGTADWQATFEPIKEPLLDLQPASLEVTAAATGDLVVRNLGPKPAAFSLGCSDHRIHLTTQDGEIGPWPAEIKVGVSADVSDLDLGAVLIARVKAGIRGSDAQPVEAEVRAYAPLPENLALKAQATASSVWAPEYDAGKAIDGNTNTRWNSRAGDKDGCWLDLTWGKPVRFNRVVIDECLDFGPRIQAWKLLAGDGQLAEIAHGQPAGNRHVVNLPGPVEARRVRFLVEKASVVPTIWEIEVYMTDSKVQRGPGRP
jgi:hypothetical protein